MNKLIRLWNEYLSQALFTTHVWLHTVIKKSSFYLLYKIHFRILSDDNLLISSNVSVTDSEKWINQVNHVKMMINELLLNQVIQTQWIKNSVVTKLQLKKNDWVLVWNKESQKFQLKWFKLYKILKSHSFDTYALMKSDDCVLHNLINESRLIKTEVNDLKWL